jgi:hypothetical protein
VRRAVLLALALVLGVGVQTASAQTVSFYSPTGDSALVILTGDTGTVYLRATSASGGVSAYRVTIFLDDSRVTLAAADSVGYTQLAVPTITPGSGQVTVEASGTGYNYTTVDLAKLTFAMAGGAQEGTLLSLRVDSLASTTSVDLLPNHRTGVFDVCQAVQRWGDLDDTRTITSRDALIAVTHAVGLPVGGFDVSGGDVDDDGLTTTRDALLMLTYAVQDYVASYYRVGKNRANRCAPLEPMPGDAAFWRSTQLWKVASGDTVAAYTGVTSSNGYSYPSSWAPDGSRIVFSEYLSAISAYGFVAVSPDGASRDTIAIPGYYGGDFSPAWSPDGTRIAFVSYRTGSSYYSVFLADVDGQGPLRLTDTLAVDMNSRLDWSPDGLRIAFRAYNQGACCSYKLWRINADGTGLAEVYPGSSGQQPLNAVWSPAGDSLAYDNSSTNMIYRVAASGDSVGVRASRLSGVHDYPNWLPAGIVFRGVQATYGAFLVTPGGRHLRITDGSSADQWLTVRRNTRYVNSVAMAPPSAIIAPTGTQEFTVTVLDNLGAAIVPGSGIRCTSSSPAVATVVTNASQNCLVTGVAAGTATITATAGGWRSATASVTVQ